MHTKFQEATGTSCKEIPAEHEEKVLPYEAGQTVGQQAKEVEGSSSLQIFKIQQGNALSNLSWF